MMTSSQIARRSDPCEGISAHGYLGIEGAVVQRISDWIRTVGGRSLLEATKHSRPLAHTTYRVQPFVSHLSFAFASALVCHCMFEGASGPPLASGTT